MNKIINIINIMSLFIWYGVLILQIVNPITDPSVLQKFLCVCIILIIIHTINLMVQNNNNE